MSVIAASPGPLTTHPIIEIVIGVVISSRDSYNFFIVSTTGNC